MAAEAKDALRAVLLPLVMAEPAGVVLAQLLAGLARIARADVPFRWPTLVPTLVATLPDASRGDRALLVLYRVLKVLASRRTVSYRTFFAAVAAEVLPFLAPVWELALAAVSGLLAAQQPAAAATQALERARGAHRAHWPRGADAGGRRARAPGPRRAA